MILDRISIDVRGLPFLEARLTFGTILFIIIDKEKTLCEWRLFEVDG